MPKYKPNPTIITGGTGTGNILQARRSKVGMRARRGKRRSRKSIVMMSGPARLPKLIRR